MYIRVKRFLKRQLVSCLCIFVALALCFQLGTTPIVKSYAMAGAELLVIGTLLTACGFTFASSGALGAAANKVSSTADGTFKTGLTQFLADAGEQMTEGTIKTLAVPLLLMQSASAFFKKTFPPTSTTVPEHAFTGSLSCNGSIVVPKYNPLKSYPDYDRLIFRMADGTYRGVTFISTNNRIAVGRYLQNDREATKFYEKTIPIPSNTSANKIDSIAKFEISSPSSAVPLRVDISVTFSGYVRGADGINNAGYFNGDLTFDLPASELTTLIGDWRTATYIGVGSAASMGAGSVALPGDIDYTADKDICVDGVLDKALADLLAKGNATTDLLFYPELDKLLDLQTKDLIADQALRDALDKIIAGSKPGELPGEVVGDIDLPKMGDLSLPATIISVFPFCIPWDIKRGLELLNAPAIAPRFEVPFVYSDLVNESFVVDFSRWDSIIRFIRWAELAVFTVGLAVMTRKVIKW